MSYAREKLQILGGGFNLLPPGDKTPRTDYLLAQNWRADRDGRLVSRYGYPLKFSLSGPAYAHSAAIFGGVEGDYYTAANAMLGDHPGALYYNFGPEPLVSGLSGRRVGMVPMNGWMWVLDSAVQGRHNAAQGWQPWGLAAPVDPLTAAPGAANANGPNGTYQFFVTFGTPDESVESNPGPASAPVTVANQNIELSGIPLGDSLTGSRNIYAVGGTLGQPYLVGSLDDNVTITFTVSTSDLTATGTGIVMATDHDAPPAGAGLVGPHFARLFTWLGNRLYYTDPDQPQYWPGSADPAVGNWVDVGMDGEAIVWCSIKTNTLLIYKERSIWRLVGDPDTGTLEQVEDGTGLVSAFALAPAGSLDYFVAPNGLRIATVDGTRDFSGQIRPLFQSNSLNGGPLTPPGGILPGPDYLATTLDTYSTVLGYAMGKLYVAYTENAAASSSVLLVYDEQAKRWMYHRNALGTVGFQGFLFDGVEMVGLTGTGGGGITGGGGGGGSTVLTQVALLLPGTIAVVTNAAPLVSLPQDGQATAVAAMLKAPAVGGPVTVEIRAGGALLGTISIPAGATMGTSAGTMATVAANTAITLNVLAVGPSFPGADLSVQVWFATTSGGGGGGGGTPVGSVAYGYNVDDFHDCFTQDPGATPIECVYQSHFEDCNLPDNQKNWLELVVDYEMAGDMGTVYVALDNGTKPLTQVGTISGSGRRSASFALALNGATGNVEVRNPASTSQLDALSKNISVAIDVVANLPVAIHNVYLYYYVEARLAVAASTIPLDLGSARVKQCKELQLDIDASGGAVDAFVSSDLPGNLLAVRQRPAVAQTGGRGLLKFPFSMTEGYLWRVALAAVSGAFRLYSARLLMRVVGVYVEAYESAAGFVWDSMELSFESGLTHIPRQYAIALASVPIKRFRELSLEIETFGGNVTLNFLTDLPGNQQAVHFTATVNTGAAGRRFVRLPLPAGTAAPVEGRICRLQLSGSSKFILYDAAVEVLAVGVYLEAYEAAGGAVYDSREIDFGSAKPKEARELELDIETSGAITATLYADLPGYTMAQVFQHAVSTTGRQKIKLPITTGAAPYNWPMGRMYRLILTGANAYRLYGAKLRLREFNCYLTGDEASANPVGVWDSTPLDFETERLKDFKKVELDIQTDAAATLKIWTDQGAGTLSQQFTCSIDTGGARQAVRLTLPPGIRGRLFQAEISGAGVRLLAGRVWLRPLNEPKAEWTWAPLPIPPTPPEWTWAPFPVNPTEPQWFWAKVLSVDETPDKWEWVDVPFEVQG